MKMRNYRKTEENESTDKSRTRRPFQLLILLYLFFFICSQLTSPTSASFQDVTTIRGTLSADPDMEHQQEEKESPLQSEGENSVDIADEGIEEDQSDEQERQDSGEVSETEEQVQESHKKKQSPNEKEGDQEEKPQDQDISQEASRPDANVVGDQEKQGIEIEAEQATKSEGQGETEPDSAKDIIESDMQKSDPSE